MTITIKKALIEKRATAPNKFELRREELARAALEALAEYGYANTSLRDIASQSGFSLGTLHYYFVDKADLISYCARNYKHHFIEESNAIIIAATDFEALRTGISQYFVRAITTDNKKHRLWYDIKSQSMFEPAFREVVREIDQLLCSMISNLRNRIQELSQLRIEISDRALYWLLDGMFQHYLRAQIVNEKGLAKKFEQEISGVFDSLGPK